MIIIIKLKECKKKDKYLDLARELKKIMEHKSDDCTNCDWCFWHSNLKIFKGPGGFGSWWTSGDQQTTGLLKTARILRRVLET